LCNNKNNVIATKLAETLATIVSLRSKGERGEGGEEELKSEEGEGEEGGGSDP
jgi:hypothetical protein